MPVLVVAQPASVGAGALCLSSQVEHSLYEAAQM